MVGDRVTGTRQSSKWNAWSTNDGDRGEEREITQGLLNMYLMSGAPLSLEQLVQSWKVGVCTDVCKLYV